MNQIARDIDLGNIALRHGDPVFVAHGRVRCKAAFLVYLKVDDLHSLLGSGEGTRLESAHLSRNTVIWWLTVVVFCQNAKKGPKTSPFLAEDFFFTFSPLTMSDLIVEHLPSDCAKKSLGDYHLALTIVK